MFHKVGEVLLCFRTSGGDHFISFRVFCSIVQPPLPSNQSPITRCHGPLHPQQRGQRSSITCSSFHFHYRRTTPKETHSDEWSRTPGSRRISPGSPFPLSTVTSRYLCIRDMVQGTCRRVGAKKLH